jgi:hypothetical protein
VILAGIDRVCRLDLVGVVVSHPSIHGFFGLFVVGGFGVVDSRDACSSGESLSYRESS